MSTEEEKPQAFEGVGETFREALDNAATAAMARGIPEDTTLEVTRHVVKISNPRVTEHKVLLITTP